MSIYNLSAVTLEGEPIALSRFVGKVTLFVNVASYCGMTPQYTTLEALHQRFGPRGFSVVGVPSNDFGQQEPGGPEQIREFCQTRYAVGFPLLSKVSVKAGPDQSPLYAALGEQSGRLPTWNFGKYLVGRDGKVLAYFESKAAPDDPRLLATLEQALAAR